MADDEETVDFTPSSLTLDEAAYVEEIAGRPVGEVLVGLLRGKFAAKDLRAIAVVVKRRTDPDFTLDDLDGSMNVAGLLTSAATSGMMADLQEDTLRGAPDG